MATSTPSKRNAAIFADTITVSGDTVIGGNLTVSGTTTTINTETINLADNIIVLNSNASGAATEDAGIEIERGTDTNVSLLWDETNNRWTVGSSNFVAGTFIGALSGNASTASSAAKWTTARTLSLTGAVTGSVSIDGSGNVSLATTATSDPTLTLTGDVTGSATFTNLGNATLTATVANDSHSHSNYVLKTGDTMTGLLTINTTNDAQLQLQSTDSWTGIGFNDGASAGAEYIWHNGGNGTFSIGGVGSNVANKKLHIHGATSIGSGLKDTAVPVNGLLVEEEVQASSVASTRLRLIGGSRTEPDEGSYFYWLWPDNATDTTNWKKICDVTVGTGLYKALAMNITTYSYSGNFGSTVFSAKEEYTVSFYRSGGTQDDQNTASIYGFNKHDHELRIVKTATGVYELQARAKSSYRHLAVEIHVQGTNGGAVSVAGSVSNGSTTGTIYNVINPGTSSTHPLVVLPRLQASDATFINNATAQVFYDRDNTSYYIDGNNESNLSRLIINGGDDNSNKADLSVGCGGNPQISLFGNSVNMGGTDMNWASKFYYASGTFLGAWDNQITIFVQGGTVDRNIVFQPSLAGTSTTRLTVTPNAGVQASQDMRAPIFYDLDNTAYYWNPNINNMHQFQTPSGYIQIGPANTSHCHIQTDRSNFYFNKELRVDSGVIGSYNEDLYLRRASNSSHQIQIAAGTTTISQNTVVQGTLTANSVSVSDGFGTLYTFAESIQLTTSWQDTSIAGSDLPTGSYVVQVSVNDYSVGGGQYSETYTGYMSWIATGTNDTSWDEIPLHSAGHADNDQAIYLRTLRRASPSTLILQIAGETNNTAASTYTFKFRRMI